MKNMCESCGMPLTKDPEKGGSESDGSKSTKYCSYCYKNGAFTFDCPDGKTMRDTTRKILRERGMNPVKAWILTVGIPYLPRWKNK